MTMPALRLLDDLRAPAGFAAGVEPLAAVEARAFRTWRSAAGSAGAAGAVGVVVVVGPAEAEPVLPVLLHRAGPVAALPVVALGGEEQVAGAINADGRDGRINQFLGVGKSLASLEPAASAGTPRHAREFRRHPGD